MKYNFYVEYDLERLKFVADLLSLQPDSEPAAHCSGEDKLDFARLVASNISSSIRYHVRKAYSQYTGVVQQKNIF